MTDLEKKLKGYYSHALSHENNLDSLKAKADLKKSTPWYKKKAIIFPGLSVLAAGAACAVVFSVVGLNQTKSVTIADAAQVKSAIIKMDLNPSIVISVNDEGKVNSIYGENDDGKLITIGEDYIGKNYWDVTKDIFDTEMATGYFVTNNKNVEYNKLSISIYSDNGNYGETFAKQVSSYLISKNVLVNEGDVSTTDSEDYEDLDNDDDDISIDDDDDFDEVQNKIDEYYAQSEEYAVKVVEEFVNFSTYYQDKVAYIESAISVLEAEGKDYSSYEATITKLKEKITGYLSLYSKIFVENESTYMNKYKELIEEKIEVFKARYELDENATSEEIEALESLDSTLDSYIQNLDLFRKEMLDSIKSRLDSLTATLEEFATLTTSEDFRKVVATKNFNNEYTSRHASYVSSFRNQYRKSFDSWSNLVKQLKESLKKSIESTK